MRIVDMDSMAEWKVIEHDENKQTPILGKDYLRVYRSAKDGIQVSFHGRLKQNFFHFPLVRRSTRNLAWEICEALLEGSSNIPPFAFLDLFLDAIGEEENRKFQEYLEKGKENT